MHWYIVINIFEAPSTFTNTSSSEAVAIATREGPLVTGERGTHRSKTYQQTDEALYKNISTKRKYNLEDYLLGAVTDPPTHHGPSRSVTVCHGGFRQCRIFKYCFMYSSRSVTVCHGLSRSVTIPQLWRLWQVRPSDIPTLLRGQIYSEYLSVCHHFSIPLKHAGRWDFEIFSQSIYGITDSHSWKLLTVGMYPKLNCRSQNRHRVVKRNVP